MATTDDTARNLANYDTAWSVAHYASTVGLRPVEARLVDRYFPPAPARVLELGCGAGRATVGLADRGYQVIPLDLSWPLLAAAKARYPDLWWTRMDATRLACADASCDAVMFSYNGIDALSPLAARLACMRESFRVLRPGGVFLLSSHNLLGTLWSAGPLHWPTYRAFLATVRRHWRDPRVHAWYWPYVDGGGEQNLYSAPPRRTVAQLRATGFDLLEMCGEDHRSRPWQLLMSQQHVHFVARKP